MANGSYFSRGAFLEVDMSDVQQKIDLLRGVLKPEAFERLLHRTFKEVGERSRTPIARETQREYAVTQAWVKSGIGRYQLSTSGAGVTCKIPLKSTKGIIGGRFSATGRRGTPISTRILRTARSTLPSVMPSRLGGNPPFMGEGKIGGLVFTRKTQDRLPIIRVVGLGIPQMPLNRAADEVQDRILEIAAQRLEHNFYYMLGNGQLT